MTEATVDAIVTDVVLVTELYRLSACHIGFGGIRRTGERCQEPENTPDYDEAAKDRDLGNGVRAAMKDLWHVSVSLAFPTCFSFGLAWAQPKS